MCTCTFLVNTSHNIRASGGFSGAGYTVAERAQRAANRKKNPCKLRKPLPQFYNAHAANAHNTTKQRNALQIEKKPLQIKKTTSSILQRTRWKCSQHNQTKKRTANNIYLFVLWAFAVCFFICLCCEHLHHLLSNWCFLDLLVLFLFACVFWSCSALSSLGHRYRGMANRLLLWVFTVFSFVYI